MSGQIKKQWNHDNSAPFLNPPLWQTAECFLSVLLINFQDDITTSTKTDCSHLQYNINFTDTPYRGRLVYPVSRDIDFQ